MRTAKEHIRDGATSKIVPLSTNKKMQRKNAVSWNLCYINIPNSSFWTVVLERKWPDSFSGALAQKELLGPRPSWKRASVRCFLQTLKPAQLSARHASIWIRRTTRFFFIRPSKFRPFAQFELFKLIVLKLFLFPSCFHTAQTCSNIVLYRFTAIWGVLLLNIVIKLILVSPQHRFVIAVCTLWHCHTVKHVRHNFNFLLCLFSICNCRKTQGPQSRGGGGYVPPQYF